MVQPVLPVSQSLLPFDLNHLKPSKKLVSLLWPDRLSLVGDHEHRTEYCNLQNKHRNRKAKNGFLLDVSSVVAAIRINSITHASLAQCREMRRQSKSMRRCLRPATSPGPYCVHSWGPVVEYSRHDDRDYGNENHQDRQQPLDNALRSIGPGGNEREVEDGYHSAGANGDNDIAVIEVGGPLWEPPRFGVALIVKSVEDAGGETEGDDGQDGGGCCERREERGQFGHGKSRLHVLLYLCCVLESNVIKSELDRRRDERMDVPFVPYPSSA